MIDVHPDPYGSLCDGQQALVAEDLAELAETAERLALATGRAVTRPLGASAATA